MSSLGNLRELTKEACASYMVYLTCSGVLNVHRAKLSLLKWPDATISAITLVENRNQETLTILENDLSELVIEPIKVIYESTLERVKEVTQKDPIGIMESAIKADKIHKENPIEAKTLLIGAINQMFSVLETVTGDKYPQV